MSRKSDQKKGGWTIPIGHSVSQKDKELIVCNSELVEVFFTFVIKMKEWSDSQP